MSIIRDVPPTHMEYGAERQAVKTLVSLSSGDTFYVDAPPSRVARKLEGTVLVVVGSRWVNPVQVAQLTPARDVPSIHTPEGLED